MYTAAITIDKVLPKTTVSLPSEITARDLIEMAFVQLQSDNNLDPFTFTIAYFGYDHFGGVTTYLGYGIVSINNYKSDNSNYWELFVQGMPSNVGMDSYLVQPDDDIELKFVPVSEKADSAAARAHKAALRPSSAT